jgi:hypothetical protein
MGVRVGAGGLGQGLGERSSPPSTPRLPMSALHVARRLTSGPSSPGVRRLMSRRADLTAVPQPDER